MTDADKAAAFDSLAAALVNRWWDGRYSWFCPTPCGGPARDTPAEAVADLIDWARRIAAKRRALPVATAERAEPCAGK